MESIHMTNEVRLRRQKEQAEEEEREKIHRIRSRTMYGGK
jgi:hypothetical protein